MDSSRAGHGRGDVDHAVPTGPAGAGRRDGSREFGLTFARFELLRLLAFTRQGRLPLGKLGVRLQVHPTSITSAVDRLEAQGFVERQRHPTDGRTTLAVITRAGRRTVERATTVLNDEVFVDLGLSRTEAEALYRLLEKVRKY